MQKSVVRPKDGANMYDERGAATPNEEFFIGTPQIKS